MYVNFTNFFYIFVILIYIYRYYYANVDKIREKVKKLISEGQWDESDANKFNKFPEMRQNLLKQLNIQDYETDQRLLKEIKEKQDADQQLLEETSEALMIHASTFLPPAEPTKQTKKRNII